jgi:DNA primase
VIDVEAYVAAYGGVRSYGQSGPQMTMPCPWCGKSGCFYVNLEEHERESRGKTIIAKPGDFICFAGRCEKAGRFYRLYAELEGLDEDDARRAIAREAMGGARRRRPPLPPPQTEKRVSESATKPEGPSDVPLPEEFIPVWNGEAWRMPKYLLQRGVTRRTAARFGLGFCKRGRYEGRIVIPVRCPAGSSFVTRAVDDEVRLRYLAGPGAGRLLFGWEQSEGAGLLVINEGPFDVMAVHQAGLKSVGILGKSLRETQVQMLRQLGRAVQLVLMLDDDALDDALRQADALGPRVLVAEPLGRKDPGDSPPERIQRAVECATTVEEARNRRANEKVATLVKRRGCELSV